MSNSFTPPCSNGGNVPYRQFFDTPQVYTLAPGPPWSNTQGYTDFIGVNAQTGDYQSYPWGVFHPLYVSKAMYYGYPWPVGPWTRLDQRDLFPCGKSSTKRFIG